MPGDYRPAASVFTCAFRRRALALVRLGAARLDALEADRALACERDEDFFVIKPLQINYPRKGMTAPHPKRAHFFEPGTAPIVSALPGASSRAAIF
jgi:hypothetical protein